MKLIKEELVKALLDYLMTRPYGEVAGAVRELSRLENVPEETEKEVIKNAAEK